MLKNSKRFSRLKNEWKKNWKKEIADIFLFGSTARGKISPEDMDICLIFRNAPDLAIVKETEKILGEKTHVSSLTVDNFFTNPHSLSKTMLLEGISIISNKTFAEVFSLTAKILYSYDISKAEPSTKVKFVYLLRGRSQTKGLVTEWGGEFVSNNTFILPIDKDSEIQQVFDKWKIKYKRTKLMIMG